MLRSSTFQDLLKNVLSERTRVNSSYSLRAFARDLQMNPANLCEIVNDKKGVTSKVAREICTKLNLPPSEIDYYAELTESMYSRSKSRRDRSKGRLLKKYIQEEVSFLKDDVFRVISDWYHYGILILMECEGFSSDPKYIAEELMISEDEAKDAVERLIRVNLVEMVDNVLRKKHDVLETGGGAVPSEAIRKFTQQILAKGAVAINSQSVKERYISTLTIPIHDEDINEYGELIEIFKMELNKLADRKAKKRKPSKVYCLLTEFFKLSR